MGAVISVIADTFTKPSAFINSKANDLVGSKVPWAKGIIEDPFEQMKGAIKDPTTLVKKPLKNLATGYDELSGKADDRRKAVAEAAAGKVQNDALLAEAADQANTKNYNDAALVSAKQAQLAARAALSSRASRARARRGSLQPDSAGGTSIGGVKGYGSTIGGGA